MTVYPRVGGGNLCRRRGLLAGRGLSPRGRGKRRFLAIPLTPVRSIPAWAGETTWSWPCTTSARVYPRVGGGNKESTRADSRCSGLSPRGRGKPHLVPLDGIYQGSIPAWAGETTSWWGIPATGRVYPRVGGGNMMVCAGSLSWYGLSPRGRGKLAMPPGDCGNKRSIPAWAGETGRRGAASCRTAVYPRVGGGNNPANIPCAFCGGLSPRGRGKPGRRPRAIATGGSIPAWAGETRWGGPWP